MPTVFSYVLGRPSALQTIEEIPAETPAVVEEVVEEVNPSILGDEPES
jgi:hypothetical protein